MSKGLLTLQTDLKSLRYGNDKPYVTKDINNPPSSNQTGMQGTKRVDDLSRIAQMLVDRPGLKHLGNEALLHQIGVQDRFEKSRKSGKSVAGSILKELGGTALTAVKVVGSTLAQVPVNGTGTHFLRGFRTDTYLQPTNGNHYSQFASFFGAGGVEGAPSAIKGEEVIGTVETSLVGKYSKYDYDDYLNLPTGSNQARLNAEAGSPVKVGTYETTTSPDTSKGRSNQLSEADKQEILPDNGNDGTQNYNELNTYTGRSSVDNIGNVLAGKHIFSSIEGQDYTFHNETPYGQTAVAGNYPSGSIPQEISLNKLREEINSGSIEIVYEDFKKTTIQDFRKGSTSSYSFNYNDKNVKKESRVGLGTQGRKGKSKTNYMITDDVDVDKLNALDVTTTAVSGNEEARDMAKFHFEIITPEESTFLYFRAFIDSIDDGYTADWKGHRYVGRAENFYTYGGFNREINISFKIAAATRKEMKPLYKKMVFLASSTAPTYGTSGLMRGTLARLTVGSYFSQIPGVITSVKYTLDNEAPWEIALANPDGGGKNKTDDDVQELPMVLNCSVSFKPIHDFAPQTGLHHYFTSKDKNRGSNPFF